MKRAFYHFIGFIVVSFFGLGLLLHYLAHGYIHQEAEGRVMSDLEKLTTVTRSSLARGEYNDIAKIVRLWGEKDPHIMAIRVMLNDATPIAGFSRNIQSRHFLDLSRNVSGTSDRVYTYGIQYDLSGHKQNALIVRLIYWSVCCSAATLFIAYLWFILQRMAILPLQREITERKKATIALRESEEKYRSMMESLSDPVYICSSDYQIEYLNPAMEKRIGRDATGEFCFKAIHALDEKCSWCTLKKSFKEKNTLSDITSPLDNRIYNISSAPIIHKDGSRSKIIVFRDITLHNKMMTSLQEYSDIINKSPVVAFRWKNDEGWPVEFVSENVEELTGYASDDLSSGKIYFVSLLHPDDRERVMNEVSYYSNAEQKTSFTHEPYRIVTKDGQEKWVEDRTFIRRDRNGNVTHYEGIVSDITAQKKFELEKISLESQLLQAQKMEAIGTLAGGIAHDFNNILSPIIGFAEICLDEIPKETEVYDNLLEILKAGNRARDLVRQILTFSRQTDMDQKPVVVSKIVEEALKLLRSSLPSTIEIHQNLVSKEPVMANPTWIHQIIMNLCTNAGHAMEKDGGTLTVRLTEVDLSTDFTDQYPALVPGSYLKLSVSDTGCGIAPQIMERIFDPYFTTKKAGKGTGLGLSVIQGIVQDCNGTITVESNPDSGTTFDVYLPVIRTGGIEQDVDEDFPICFGTEHVLFVDDEQPIAEMGKILLQNLGYTVTVRSSSVEALALFKTKPAEFDLVITDMTMPNMTGDKLAVELIAIRPDIPIILCTGYSELFSPGEAEKLGVKAYLMKPVTRRDFGVTVRKVLDGPIND